MKLIPTLALDFDRHARLCAERPRLRRRRRRRPRSRSRECRKCRRRRCSTTFGSCRLTSSKGAPLAPPVKNAQSSTSTAEFKKLGLKPGNTDGTYVQKVPLVGITGAERKPLTVTGKAQGDVQMARRGRGVDQTRRRRREHRELRSRVRRLRRRRARVSTGTTSRASTSKARRSSCSSTIRRFPIRRTPSKLDAKTFGGTAMTYYGRWTYKFEEGARQGRRRHAHRPRDRPGRLSVRRRAGQSEREVRPRHARQEHGPRRRSRAGSRSTRRSSCSRWPDRTSTR